MKPRFLLLFVFITSWSYASGQGLNHNWLIGYQSITDTFSISTKAWLQYSSNSFNIIPDNYKMRFGSTQANISDSLGNFLMSSNGVWIMDASGDTMLNGSGLNPNSCTQSFINGGGFVTFPHVNIIIPFPGQLNKYILFHTTCNYDYNLRSSELYYTVIDMTLNNGLGGVVPNQKNVIVLQDTLSAGLAATRHANGRDWWIVVLRDNSNYIHKVLLTPSGISLVTIQNLGIYNGNQVSTQLTFSPDGKKLAFTNYTGTFGNFINKIRLFDFDRCTGNFSNPQLIDISDGNMGFGLAFSPNSKILYATSVERIFQLKLDTSDIAVSKKIVAIFDGFSYPNPPWYTDFWRMYLAANGKIYVSSGSSVLYLSVIEYPDSSDLACGVLQHSIHLPCWSYRSHVNHPNYYLGCDTTCTPCLVSVNEIEHDFNLNIYPNPSSGKFNLIYLLPQNKDGKMEIFDITGKVVYEKRLPQWSTLQQVSLPSQISYGLYNCVITSGKNRVSKKIAIIKD